MADSLLTSGVFYPCMSASDPTVTELRGMLLRGDITADELVDRLTDIEDTPPRDQLWARWADQGLFDDPITQEGFTSFKGNRVQEVDTDGERQR